jgi:hypothetical protein
VLDAGHLPGATSVTEPKPTLFSSAEAATRRVMLSISLGLFAVFVGAVVTVNLLGDVAAHFRESPFILRATAFVFERFWQFGVLAFFGFLCGRFFRVEARHFAVLSSVAGEVFSLLILMAMSGLEHEALDAQQLAKRGVGFVMSTLVVLQLTRWGLRRGERSDQKALERAATTKAEYEEFLNAAEHAKETPPSGSK